MVKDKVNLKVLADGVMGPSKFTVKVWDKVPGATFTLSGPAGTLGAGVPVPGTLPPGSGVPLKPAMVKFGLNVDTVQAMSANTLYTGIHDILTEALGNPALATKEDVAAVLVATMTNLMNAVWTAGNQVADTLMPAEAGKHHRMRATTHFDENGKKDPYMHFFVCSVTNSGKPDSNLEPFA